MSYMDEYNPFQNVSYLELNKRKRGDYVRDEQERIENRFSKPAVKKLYLKRNGEEIDKRAKLFVWREWQSPGLRNLLSEVGNSVGLADGAQAMYDLNGDRIQHSDELQHLGIYYVTGDEQLLIQDSSEDYSYNQRHTSLSAPEFSATRESLYDEDASFPPTPPPKPYSSDPYLNQPKKSKKKKKQTYPGSLNMNPNRADAHRREMDEFERYYREAVTSPNYPQEESTSHRRTDHGRRESYQDNPRYRSRSTNEDYSHRMNSDFDDVDWIQKDRRALEKHKEKVMSRTRSNSTIIYNRRDQTHPDAYILYVFLNGQGMECQYINFQKKQLEKGMNYIMELIARRYSVNPGKLCNMDGKKIAEVSHLMSRGAYVLVPVGQSFRDTWYFLPDNAIDTSSSQARIEDRSNQRDRFLQKKEKKEKVKKKSQGLSYTSNYGYR